LSNGVLYAAESGANDGVLRTPTPLADAGTLGWDVLSTGDAAGSTLARNPSSLRVVNNVAYAIDTNILVPTVNAYDDYLATSAPTLIAPADGATIIIDPVTGRAEVVWATWDAMGSGAGQVNFVVIWAWETELGMGAFIGTPATFVLGTAPRIDLAVALPAAGLPLRANTEYTWIVRAANTVSGDGIRSKWSEARSFSVQAGGLVIATQAGPILLGPQGGATDVSLTPGFSWAPLSGVTDFQFILATDAAMTNTVAGTPVTVYQPSYQVTEDLDYSTTYFWAVKAVAPAESPQSIGTFTTMDEPPAEVFTCPTCGLTFDSREALEAHLATHVPPPEVTPAYIWAIIGVGAILVIAVLVLIVRTRRPL